MAGITKLIPLFLLFTFIAVFVWIGYQMYLFSLQMADRGQKKMEKHNISLNKDGGVKVGVKQVSAEEYAAKQQAGLVSMWNYSSWPAYKSRFWNKEAAAAPATPNEKPSTSRQSSSTNVKPSASRTGSSTNVKPTTSRHASSTSAR